jgi:hypothetical protein
VTEAGPTANARAYATLSVPTDTLLLPEQWVKATVMEAGGAGLYRSPLDADSGYSVVRGSLGAGLSSGTAPTGQELSRAYLRAEGSIGGVRPIIGTRSQIHLRLYGGIANGAPTQRAIFASSQNPFETFNNDLFRSRGACSSGPVSTISRSAGRPRGFGLDVALDRVASGNVELVRDW